jgi:plasmid stabilization system protein ParE
VRIRWLRTEPRNLDEEASYIAADDSAAARREVKRIFEAVNQLAAQPSLGRPERVPGTRDLIPYRVTRDATEILRVVHTSRPMPARR